MSLQKNHKITTCLWFDSQASEAATFYTAVFPSSRIIQTWNYTSAGQEQHKKTPGSVMMVSFELDGQPFMAINGGPPEFLNAATSFMIECKDQVEIDYFWEKLGQGTEEDERACGWLKDRLGISWQVVPRALGNVWSKDTDGEKMRRVMEAMFGMGKLDVKELQKAFEGVEEA